LSLSVFRSKTFKRDIKKAKKQNKNLEKLKVAIILLISGQQLPKEYNDHQLIGNYKRYRECHIESDWLLMYRIENYELQLVRIGSHSELF